MDSVLIDQLDKALQQATSMRAFEEVKAQFLGKKGLLTQEMKALGALQGEERRVRGAKLNTLKSTIVKVLDSHKAHIESLELLKALEKEALDVTLPSCAKEHAVGVAHPLSCAMREMVELFLCKGFSLKEGPEIEDEDHNFTFLNISKDHPARAEHDTFYLKGVPYLLRTHTSSVEIRAVHEKKPPLRMVSCGRVYRSDSDATHTPMFHQIEGLVIEPSIHMGHLKGCLSSFLNHYFQKPLKVRFRPSYFPFTTPSMEVDILMESSQERGAKKAKWLEVLGCGMVHPNVLRYMGLDPENYQGFAFGLGVERLLMLKQGLNDLRSLYMPHLSWLKHFGKKRVF